MVTWGVFDAGMAAASTVVVDGTAESAADGAQRDLCDV